VAPQIPRADRSGDRAHDTAGFLNCRRRKAMKLDALIEQLAADLAPVRSRRSWVDISIVALVGVIELALLFTLGFARPDMHRMLTLPTMGWRLASLGLISLVSGFFAIRSFDPTCSAQRFVRWLALLIAICLAYGLVMGGMPAGVANMTHRMDWMDGVHCAAKIVLLSIPPLSALAVLGHRGAPTDMRRTPLLIGLAAATWGAFVFVFVCPFNDFLYIVVWYGVGCGIVTLASRFLLPRFVRW
jgi:hypothetical protein